MSSRDWVTITCEYNDALEEKNSTLGHGLLTVRKNPRAVLEKLKEVENIIMTRLVNQNFLCEHNRSSFFVYHHSSILHLSIIWDFTVLDQAL